MIIISIILYVLGAMLFFIGDSIIAMDSPRWISLCLAVFWPLLVIIEVVGFLLDFLGQNNG
jgi:hypothetical protein